jgi:hypothetical protein
MDSRIWASSPVAARTTGSTERVLRACTASVLGGRPGRARGARDRGGAGRRLAKPRADLLQRPGLLDADSYLPLGTTAHKQGRIAGENAVGGDRRFEGSLGTQVVKVFELAIARAGLRDEEALAAGLEPLTDESRGLDHKAYYPSAHPIIARLTGDRVSDGCSAPNFLATSTRRCRSESTSPPPRSFTA